MVKASASGGKAQAIYTWWSRLSFTIGIKEEKGLYENDFLKRSMGEYMRVIWFCQGQRHCSISQRMALSLLCCLAKELNAEEPKHLRDEIEHRQSTHDHRQDVGDHVVEEAIGVAAHQPFLVHQVQNSK